MLFRCAHCKTPIEIAEDETAFNNCPTCSSSLISPVAALSELAPGTRIEHFELLQLVGEGSYGAVWKATDHQLDRPVAIKLPRIEAVDTEQLLKEARAAAQVKHPAIVDVYEIGSHEGSPYIVTEFIDGLTLESWLQQHRPSPYESAKICRELADAMHAAHEHGVIHRDLKPSNVMVDGDGRVHITDFGVAKREDGEATLTVDGQLVGTPAYMSPEQARGEANRVDRHTDIYSLGAILYRMLAGHAPFRGQSHAIIPQVISGRHSPLPWGVPAPLRRICVKAMSLNAQDRFESAEDLAADVSRYLEGRRVHARPSVATLYSRANRLVADHPIGSLTGGLALLIPVCFVFWGSEDVGGYKPTPGLRDKRITQSDHYEVVIKTDPPASRLVIVPTYGRTCTKAVDRQSIERSGAKVAAPVDLPPGHYLIVAQAADGSFHEVMRTVPDSHTLYGDFPHNTWDVVDNVIHLPVIHLFGPNDHRGDLVRIDGGECTFGTDSANDTAFRYTAVVPPFRLGRNEVLHGAYKRVLTEELGYPMESEDNLATLPATRLDIDAVLAFLEACGCRLPTEQEYEFAATNGGTTRFPWGDEDRAKSFDMHPATIDTFDYDTAESGVSHLYTSAAEVNWSHGMNMRSVITGKAGRIDSERVVFSVRGLSPELRGDKRDVDARTRNGWSASMIKRSHRVGFRAARSVRPRWDWSIAGAPEPSP